MHSAHAARPIATGHNAHGVGSSHLTNCRTERPTTAHIGKARGNHPSWHRDGPAIHIPVATAQRKQPRHSACQPQDPFQRKTSKRKERHLTIKNSKRKTSHHNSNIPPNHSKTSLLPTVTQAYVLSSFPSRLHPSQLPALLQPFLRRHTQHSHTALQTTYLHNHLAAPR